MKWPFVFGKKSEPSRRSVVAKRQSELRGDDLLSAKSYLKNRTLNSRHTASPAETSERLESHKLANKRRRLVRHLTWVLCIIALVIVILWQSVLVITPVTPQGIKDNESQNYASILKSYYGDRPIERLRFMIDQNSLKSYFLTHAPEVKTIRIEGIGIAKAQVKLTFRQPVVQWSSAGVTYFVDDEGVTFEKNYFEAPSVTVRDESGVPAEAGQEVINRQFLSFLGQGVSAFKKNDMIVSEVILPENTVRQVMFVLEGRNYPIKMTIDRGANAQVAQAIKTIGYLDGRGGSLQYIDVRVNQRTFYK